MARRLIVCLDGTNNEPETTNTNVARIYEMVVKDDDQIVYYDPGVGTMGARSASSRLGELLSRIGGLAFGHGVDDNIEEAYRFLMTNYVDGDEIFLFGFSRGAYTARALAGMLRTVGLLRPGADNLVPYALKLYTKAGKEDLKEDEEREFWRVRNEFNRTFGNPSFPNRFAPQIQFLGAWDTVKFVGWFNWRAQWQQARWPFTRKLSNVVVGRHALAIHERRRYYAEYRFDSDEVAAASRDLSECWLIGVHSDVGGTFPDDHRLADIALQWIVDAAMAAGLRVDAKVYRKHIGVSPGDQLPDDYAQGRIHANRRLWFALGLGWRKRRIAPGDPIHPTVGLRTNGSGDSPGTARRAQQKTWRPGP